MNPPNNGTQRKMQIAVLMSLTAIGLTLSTKAVQAADEASFAPTATKVQFADLNLSNPQGIIRLYGRIVGAAKKV